MAKIINTFEEAVETERNANIMIIIGIVLIVAVVSVPVGVILLIIGVTQRDAAISAQNRFKADKKREDTTAQVINTVASKVEKGIDSLIKKEPKETFVNCEHCGGKNSTKSLKCEHCSAHLKA